ncbi:hypothetical protein SmJEL517_g00711 [Synchytrium microbalum]|uniref:NDT80 domain-containing protein n=1 Tax=Synchytrium microbalum TaxID=1806994 RepID=A0A507CHX7_9FUNG|nr:uncharacterized protein SmJEL517_g00711 [Synchytrium microbalum]TPX37674.1 hypothetical protein SmJEL517_g00711 [Synchytrium microbalum]
MDEESINNHNLKQKEPFRTGVDNHMKQHELFDLENDEFSTTSTPQTAESALLSFHREHPVEVKEEFQDEGGHWNTTEQQPAVQYTVPPNELHGRIITTITTTVIPASEQERNHPSTITATPSPARRKSKRLQGSISTPASSVQSSRSTPSSPSTSPEPEEEDEDHTYRESRRQKSDSSNTGNFLQPPSSNQPPCFFRSTKQLFALYSQDGSQTFNIKIRGKVDRGFFLAEGDWTCYRRNYFQISAGFLCLDSKGATVLAPCAMQSQHAGLVNVKSFSLNLTAMSGDKKVAVVQHTAKRDKGPQLIPQPRVVASGGDPNIPIAPPPTVICTDGLDVKGPSRAMNPSILSFERLQFKNATANNGKRRAQQQYYTLVIELFANIEGISTPKLIATCESVGCIVRGRSPGHYGDKTNGKEGGPVDVRELSPQRPTHHSTRSLARGMPSGISAPPPSPAPSPARYTAFPPTISNLPRRATLSHLGGPFSLATPIVPGDQRRRMSLAVMQPTSPYYNPYYQFPAVAYPQSAAGDLLSSAPPQSPYSHPSPYNYPSPYNNNIGQHRPRSYSITESDMSFASQGTGGASPSSYSDNNGDEDDTMDRFDIDLSEETPATTDTNHIQTFQPSQFAGVGHDLMNQLLTIEDEDEDVELERLLQMVAQTHD